MKIGIHSWRLTLIACLAWLTVTGVVGASRPGFAPDEELTSLVADSSPLLGLPRLPSGVFYFRGLIYGKLADLAGTIFTPDLRVYRLVSLVFGLGGLAALALLCRRWSGLIASGAACVLLVTSPLYVATSTFARAYTGTIALLLVCCLLVRSALERRLHEWLFLTVTALLQGMHEGGVVVILLPAAVLWTMDRDDSLRRRAAWLVAKTMLVAVAVQGILAVSFSVSVENQLGQAAGPLALFVLRTIPLPPMFVPALAGPFAICLAVALSGGLAYGLRRKVALQLWELIVGAALAGCFLLGALIGAMVLGLLRRPQHAHRYLIAGACYLAFSAAFWTSHTLLASDAALSWRFVTGLVWNACLYPLSWVSYLAFNLPAAFFFALAAAVSTIRHPSADRRVALVLVWMLLLAFGIAKVPLIDRYFLLMLPFVILLAAQGVVDVCDAAMRLVRNARPTLVRIATVGVAAALVATLVLEQRAYARLESNQVMAMDVGLTTSYVVPTSLDSPAAQECLRTIPATDLLVCNDELACQYLARRVDAWLLPDARLRQVCTVKRGGTDRGLYASSAVLGTQADLERFLGANASRSVTVAILDTPKFGFAEQDDIVRGLAGAKGIRGQTCGPVSLTYRFAR